jgi:transcriptional regulator with XRE-family HTH domain
MPSPNTPEGRIAQRMKKARLAAGISQEEAGRRLKTTLRTYARWERGETMGFMGHLKEIAKALDTTPEALLGGEELRPNPTTVEELSAKLDAVMDEIRQLREGLGPRPKRRVARVGHG